MNKKFSKPTKYVMMFEIFVNFSSLPVKTFLLKVV